MSDKHVIRTDEGGRFIFFCPACRCGHYFTVPPWTFNGDMDAPTVEKSILVKGVQPPTEDEVKRIMAGEKIEPRPMACHSHVTAGWIEFCADSTHALAGQRVKLEVF